MFVSKYAPRIARSIVAVICAGFIQLNISAPAAHAAAPIKPTISSITSGATSLTVNMVNTGIDASVWKWSITKRTGVSCANTYGDGTLQTTASLLSTIQITGLTSGCVYSFKVAGYNGVTGEYTDAEKLVGAFSNGLTAYYMNDSNPVASMVHTPISASTSGYCGWDTVSAIAKDWGTSAPTPANPSGTCNADNFTVYYVGYIKAPITGNVTFKSRTDDGFYLNLQGANLITDAASHGPAAAGSYNGTSTVAMVAGEIYRIETWVHEISAGSAIWLDWEYSGVSQTNIPSSFLATDPSVFYGGCPLGLAARCAAGSALEIKRATGINMNGQYWIMVNGTPTLTYCIMDSAMSGGGWMLAMKGKETSSALSYTSNLWTDTSLINESYPERWLAGDANRNVDAKYGVYAYNKGNQIMAIFPNQKSIAGGATNSQNSTYGFSWIETTTAMLPWTAYSATASGNYPAGWGGTSNNVAFTGGPTATPTCVNDPSTLSNLFNTASRCAFRQVGYLYNANETPYSAIGNGLFYSQYRIRFFGLNYGSANATNRDRVRFGFGWNENEEGNEASNDGTGGIGIDNNTWGTNLTAGTGQRCCSNQGSNPALGQNGISGGDNTYTNIPFELYTRNSVEASVNGYNLRVVANRSNSMTAGNSFTVSGTNGSNTFRLSPSREGIYINPSTGAVTVSEALPVGDYASTVSVTDSNGVSGKKTFTVQVLAESSETDTALSFDGTSQYVTTSGTYGLWGDQTHEAWVKSDSACNQTTSNKVAFGNTYFVVFCNSSYWWFSFYDNSNAWNGVQTSRRVVMGDWIHIAVVRSGTTVTAYFNNTQAKLLSGSTWVNTYTQSTVKNGYSYHVVGGSGGADQYFNGVVDEVKVWDSARTLTQIWNGAHTLEDVSQANLLIYWDFNEGTGSAISRSQRVDNNFNLTPASATQWVSVAQKSTNGPYTVITIPRTLISIKGGWRAPDSITAIYSMVVAGGGGGGGGYQGGGGGGGGVLQSRISITQGEYYPIRVGTGGNGAFNPVAPSRGETSSAFGLISIGGGAGGVEYQTPYLQIAATTGGSGGGGNWGNYITGAAGTSGQGSKGGDSSNLEAATCGSNQYMGAGGGGADTVTAGGAATCTRGGNGGAGRLSNLNSNYYGGGGGGSARYANASSFMGSGGTGGGGNSGYTSGAMVGTTGGAASGATGTGGGGGAGMSSDGLTGYGGDGGSGVVILRYITNPKPTFTQPKNAYLNVGMTETFSVNVALDSETALLTRTFRWESSTTGSAGSFSLIKSGTGAANASFSWVPPDTATSGNQFVYRVIVTDSDATGLFIVDTSTAVFATINRALRLNSKSTLTKTVNVSKTETFTVIDGTPTYSYSLTPTNTNFWLDTSTVGSPQIKFADTVTAGTYYETFTVTDSVTASVVVPLTIIVSPPPSFSANSEQVDSGTVLYLDAGNSASYPKTGTTWSDLSGRSNNANLTHSFGTTATYVDGSTRTNGITSNTNLTCSSPAFNSSALGSFDITTVGQCIYAPTALPTSGTYSPVYTLETWIKRNDTQTAWNNVICNPFRNSGDQIAICLFWIGATTINAGIYNGTTALWYRTSELTIPNKTWTHIAVTYNGATGLNMYVNDSTTVYTASVASFAWNAAKVDPGLLMGRKWDASNTMNGSIAMVRLYNRVLTTNEIYQNYHATKGRFLQTQNKQSPAGKYGTTVNETFTVTSGSETITAITTSSAVAGITWDTSTARTIRLQLQDSLSAGTYYDTVTVTDIYGSSSNLPLQIVVAKADTLTVYIETPTALTFTGAPASFTRVTRVLGLVARDTGTAVSTVTYKPGGLTCATGGACSIGDIGPGGGVVFITPSTVGGNGKYFEAAPANWFGVDETGSNRTYCSSSIDIGITNAAIGWGETNTALAKSACMGGSVALVNSFNQSNNTGYSDWFIPSSDELTELVNVRDQAGLMELRSAWNTGTWGYWGSTQIDSAVMATLVTDYGQWSIGGTTKSDSIHNMVRPVRQFSPCWSANACSSLASTSIPSQAGGYAITAAGLSLSVGSLSNYETVTYLSTLLTINRANQSPQVVPFYSPSASETFTVYTGGGSGSGAQAFSVLSSSGGNTCSFDYRKLTTTSTGTCTVQVVKQGDRNYLTDTVTATIYIALFITNQPAPAPGSGPNIALSGVTSITRDPNAAPTISAINFVDETCFGGGMFRICIPAHWEIIGEGFGARENTDTVVKFWRNKVLDWFPAISELNYVDSDTKIWLRQLPAGITTGKILVITANGIAVSPQNFVAP